jgi:hypothetical protein
MVRLSLSTQSAVFARRTAGIDDVKLPFRIATMDVAVGEILRFAMNLNGGVRPAYLHWPTA